MTRFYPAILLLTGWLAACATAPAASSQYILDADLRAAYASSDGVLEMRRSGLEFQGGRVVHSCGQYLNAVKQHHVRESVNNQANKSEYLICDALHSLENTSLASGKEYPASKVELGQRLLNRLDLRSSKSSLAQASRREEHTLAALFSDNNSAHGLVTVFEDQQSRLRLEVVAVANLDDDTTPDWIVWLSDEARTGNYRAYETLVIHDAGHRKRLTATRYPVGSAKP